MTTFTIVSGDFVKTGGMDRANYALARYIAQTQRVTLVGYRVDEELARESNVTFRPVPKPLNAYTLAAPLLGASGIIEYFGKRHDPTKVIVNGGCCPVPGTNWVHYVHAAYAPEIRASAAKRLRAHYNHWSSLATERAALRAARHVIVNSKRTYRDVVEKVGVREDRVRTVYYGIDPASFTPHDDDARAAAREELGWAAHRPHAVFVGGLNDRRKGFDVLFDAWRLLNTSRRWDGVLVVIGVGGELESWKQRATSYGFERDVLFLGFRRDVHRVLAACDVMIAPTRYEAYGLAVHEALCAGLPAIVSRDSGVAERYSSSLQWLLLDDPEDAPELARRLERWLERRDDTRALVRDEMTDLLRQRTWDDMARDILDTLA